MQPYSDGVRKVLLLTLFLNLAVVAVKLIAGLLAHSLALVSDAAHSSADGLNNIVGLVVLRYATQAPDDDHPYGHQKIETLAAFCIAAFLAITCYEIGSSAIERLFSGDTHVTNITPLTFAAIILTLIVNLYVTWYEARAGRRLKSHFLIADAAHTRSDVYVTLAVLGGTILVKLGYGYMDAVFALVVALFIARAGFMIFKETVPVLVDASALPAGDIRELVMTIHGVDSVRHIRTRGWEGHYFIDLTVHAPIADAFAAHDMTEHIEAALRERYGPATINVHVEPE